MVPDSIENQSDKNNNYNNKMNLRQKLMLGSQ